MKKSQTRNQNLSQIPSSVKRRSPTGSLARAASKRSIPHRLSILRARQVTPGRSREIRACKANEKRQFQKRFKHWQLGNGQASTRPIYNTIYTTIKQVLLLWPFTSTIFLLEKCRFSRTGSCNLVLSPIQWLPPQKHSHQIVSSLLVNILPSLNLNHSALEHTHSANLGFLLYSKSWAGSFIVVAVAMLVCDDMNA